MRIVTERYQAKNLPPELRQGIPDDATVRVTVQTEASSEEIASGFAAIADRISDRVEQV